MIERGGRVSIGDLEVNRLGYGALQLLDVGADAFGPPAAGIDAGAVLRHAVTLGINLIDTANLYGPETNEQQIAAALFPYPKGLVISTKGGLTRPDPGILVPTYEPALLRSAVEGSLRRLKLDRLDLWTLHHVDAATPIEAVMETLGELRAEGKIRHVGLSKANVAQIERARRVGPVAVVQNRYNVADRRDDAVIDYCALHQIGFMAFFPLAAGRVDRLRACVSTVANARNMSIQQIALAWLLQRAPVVIPIPGTRHASELDENVAACDIALTAEEVAAIDTNYGSLPDIVDGPTPIRHAAMQ
ncbi:MAG: NADP-dependent oxidoreductase domain protein [Bradyrhizobium sp.]|nr:NADP-dependent oxidoreductase domain protein [Bradyrhizobium sp.]